MLNSVQKFVKHISLSVDTFLWKRDIQPMNVHQTVETIHHIECSYVGFRTRQSYDISYDITTDRKLYKSVLCYLI